MYTRRAASLTLATMALLGGVALTGACAADAQDGAEPAHERLSGGTATDPAFTVDGEIALRSLMALGDGHLQKVADMFTLLATTDAVRSGDWQRIREPLAAAGRLSVPAVTWFATPDGGYWTVQEGRSDASLADRPYFPRLLEGETVLGDLVVSRATGRSTAIVAVPVRGGNNEIVGVLGASVYLDSLSARLAREMDLEPQHLFYSLDEEPLVGLHMDPDIIFLHPLDEGDPELDRAMREILSREAGIVSYQFRGKQRTVLFRASPVTGWRYAFGILQE
jgi:hypothetical protein